MTPAVRTPALLLDAQALRDNIATMARFAAAHGLALRPHAKTHKSRDIARLQVEAGAVGLCCATLAEAELLADVVPSLLLTSPLVTPETIAACVALLDRVGDLAVVVDHPAPLDLYAAAVPKSRTLRVLVDIDPGFGRTGADSPEAVVALARAIAAAPRLTYGGVQFYCGSEQHIAGFADRGTAITARNTILTAALAALNEAGLAPPVITGGGTGTHQIDAAAGLLTEIQPGSYVFMDREYLDCDFADGASPFALALRLATTVVSANHPGFVTVDAGIKAMAAEAGRPILLPPPGVEARYDFQGDEFGRLSFPAGTPLPSLGDRLELMTPHCDPTVNLHRAYHVEQDGRIERWPIGTA